LRESENRIETDDGGSLDRNRMDRRKPNIGLRLAILDQEFSEDTDMNFNDMTVGLRVKTVKPTIYYPDLNVEVPADTTGVVDRIDPADGIVLACAIVKLDQPIVYQGEQFAELWIYDADQHDRDWTGPYDFERI
jgi:hypothetical protein